MKTGDTRQRIVEAARDLFWEKGYAATGLAELLQRAGANSGSFYHFFESKDALLRTVLETYEDLLEPHVVQPAFDKHKTPVERIFALLDRYRERLVGTNCQYGCPIGRLALELDPENAPAHERIARNFTAWRDGRRGVRARGRHREAAGRRGVRADGDGRRRHAVAGVPARSSRSTPASGSCGFISTACTTEKGHQEGASMKAKMRAEDDGDGRGAGACRRPVPAIVHAADPVTVTKVTSPERALRFEVIVPGSLDEVWDAFTTADGLASWLWRDVARRREARRRLAGDVSAEHRRRNDPVADAETPDRDLSARAGSVSHRPRNADAGDLRVRAGLALIHEGDSRADRMESGEEWTPPTTTSPAATPNC